MTMIHADLPLIDLHRHLDGNVRLATILELAQQHNLPLPADNLADLRPYIQVSEPETDIMAYFQRFTWMISIFADEDACRRVAYENVLDAREEGIDYIELRFSPWFMAEPHGLDPVGVVGAVVDGVRAAVETLGDIRVNLIGIISRTYGVEIGYQELDALLAYRDDIVGLDLAGDEANFPAEWFTPHFKKARAASWGFTVHAGESAGTESVWRSIRDLGAVRIGHAVCIMDDPSLVDYMLEHRIGIEANLTSNWHTNTVASYAQHPLKTWLDAGLLATINTDDPGISPVTLRDEFEIAAPAAGLTSADTRKAQINAVEVAFLSAAEKQALLKKKAQAG
ncbi:MAG TPA: adenosine deaminase [Brevefilum fermentans]|jgi:adenosine deaminase|nr:adenosine deaminase [Brevefilum fermentans]HOM68029.1 adenosine deaminase [Brevefilum fermentans]